MERRAATGTRVDADAPVLLAVRDLHVHMPGEAVRGLDLDVREGEILGIGGLAGHGKAGVANGVIGLMPAEGEVLLDGRPLPLGDPQQSLRRGIAFVSEDRRGTGLLLDSSIERNLTAGAVTGLGRFLCGPALLGPLRPVDRAATRSFARRMIEELDIRCTGPWEPVRRLSGGNQQKVCLGAAISQKPRLLLVSEPTRGIDVGAKDRILDYLQELRSQGVTVVMTSSELGELRAVCDRIAIVYRGRVEAILAPDDSDVRFGLAMTGELER